MSATDELCKLLDERGVEYTTNKSDVYGYEVNTTRWGKHCFYERNTGEKLLESHDLTPEHVIAATLGSEPDMIEITQTYDAGFRNGVQAVFQQLDAIKNYEELQDFIGEYWGAGEGYDEP